MTSVMLPESTRIAPHDAATRRFAATNEAAAQFFNRHVDAVAQACHAMSSRFQLGGRLFICGDGAQRSDVAHVVVEFVHPVVVGKRALPALPLPEIEGGAALHALAAMGKPGDLVMLIASQDLGDSARAVLAAARAQGMLTLALIGDARGSAAVADHVFAVPTPDRCIVQETHEMLYHVLWELVHVFLEHRPVSA